MGTTGGQSLNAPLKLAVFGAGRMASSYHIPALKEYLRDHPGDLELFAVVEPDSDRGQQLQYQHGFQHSFPNLEAMLWVEKPDAALVLTPYRVNAQVAGRILAAGIHVFMEKPPGIAVQQVHDLIQLAKAKGLIVQVGYNRRHWPAVLTALQWIRDSGQPIQYIRGTIHRTDPETEHYAIFAASHSIDLLLSVGGAPVKLHSIRQTTPGTKIPSFFSTLVFESGAVGHVSALPYVSYQQEIYEFHTRDCTVTVDQHYGHCNKPAETRLYSKFDLEREEIFHKTGNEWTRTDGFLGQLETFFGALLRGGKPYPSIEECLLTIEITEAIQHDRPWRP